jgi:spore germination cell wall hydrolase CwlJ-like protein
MTWRNYESVLLALVIWREARGEPQETQLWVAWAIRRRAEHHGWWNPSGTLTGALVQPRQFSSLTNPGDPQLTVFPTHRLQAGSYVPDPSFLSAMMLADQVMAMDPTKDPTGGSDSFFDDSIKPPKGWTQERFRGKKGRMLFYQMLS